MPKNPDEIKKGLECCLQGNCNDCPYQPLYNAFRCKIERTKDAISYTQQLEARNNAMYSTILSVMYFVDKWLDCPDYDPDADLNGVDAVQRAVKAREIALQAIEQLEAERDAAVKDLKTAKRCKVCKHDHIKEMDEPCFSCSCCFGVNNFEWRGVQKEE